MLKSTQDINLATVQNNSIAVFDEDSDDKEIYSKYNIENSQDIVIGPVTHYHCPVTIIQKPGERPPKEIKENHEDKRRKLPVKQILWISSIVIALVIIISTTAVVITTSQTPEKTNDIDSQELLPLTNDTTASSFLIPRSYWGARPPTSPLVPIKVPTKYVIVAHTAGPSCNTIGDCSSYLQALQSYTVTQGSPDIGYNFLIGSDNNVYIGRGWNHRNYLEHNSLAIAVIGNFVYDEFTQGMQNTLQQFLQYGLDHGHLAEDYILLSHSQVYSTLSPGDHVRGIINKWPHYYTKDFIKIPSLSA